MFNVPPFHKICGASWLAGTFIETTCTYVTLQWRRAVRKQTDRVHLKFSPERTNNVSSFLHLTPKKRSLGITTCATALEEFVTNLETLAAVHTAQIVDFLILQARTIELRTHCGTR